MPKLIWVFAGRTLILLVLSCREARSSFFSVNDSSISKCPSGRRYKTGIRTMFLSFLSNRNEGNHKCDGLRKYRKTISKFWRQTRTILWTLQQIGRKCAKRCQYRCVCKTRTRAKYYFHASTHPFSPSPKSIGWCEHNHKRGSVCYEWDGLKLTCREIKRFYFLIHWQIVEIGQCCTVACYFIFCNITATQWSLFFFFIFFFFFFTSTHFVLVWHIFKEFWSQDFQLHWVSSRITLPDF